MCWNGPEYPADVFYRECVSRDQFECYVGVLRSYYDACGRCARFASVGVQSSVPVVEHGNGGGGESLGLWHGGEDSRVCGDTAGRVVGGCGSVSAPGCETLATVRCDGVGGRVCSEVALAGEGEVVRGRHYWRNRQRRERRKVERAGLSASVVGGARVVSASELKPGGGLDVSEGSCSGVTTLVDEVEAEARITLAQRRAAENKLAVKKTELTLARLSNPANTSSFDEMVKARYLQQRNTATERSEKSLSGLDSVRPESSSSQYEIRRQAKVLADLQLRDERLIKAMRVKFGGEEVTSLLADCEPVGTTEFNDLAGAFVGETGSVEENPYDYY